ncbi:hypothetical protein [Hanstruepera ponticola]|uniref:hypothetical protein n=1 Tax=Hanstruepera ponticola TaxID=2042995 RepID=UPI0017863352|nr:hypothetical protein [Hanstruepera ponticola]
MEQKNAEFYYPRITSFENDSILTKIELESIKNYGELIKIADRIACNGKLPVLKFNSNKTDFNFLVFKMCSESNIIADYSQRNVIFIENNTVIINDLIEKPLDSLKEILKNHILNPEKQSDYSQNIDKAIIFYYQDSLFGKEEIKKQFIKLATEFNELNKRNGDSLSLKIKLNDYPYMRIDMPIPPPPIEK